MKHQLAPVAMFILAAGLGWKLARHPEVTAGLQNVSLIRSSEHSQPGPTGALAGVRIRLSPSDFTDQIRSNAQDVPQIALAEE